MLKVLHFIYGSANPTSSNGVNKVILGMAKHANVQEGVSLDVLGLRPSQKHHVETVNRPGFDVQTFQSFKRDLLPHFEKIIDDYDVLHLHGVWSLHVIKLAKIAKSKGVPYICTVHSGLTPDRIAQSKKTLKLLFHKFIQKTYFDNAAGIQALTREEATLMKDYISGDRLFYLPNGVEVDEFKFSQRCAVKKEEKIHALFLGRLSVEKNVGAIIEAINILPQEIKKRLVCHLVGPDGGCLSDLKEMVTQFSLEKNIVFEGSLYGQEKQDLMSRCSFYIHPALSDVVSIAVMEMLAAGLPSIVTRTSQICYFSKSEAFIMVEPFFQDIARGINDLFSQESQWPAMSTAARQLVEAEFSWEKNVKKLCNVYEAISNKTDEELWY